MGAVEPYEYCAAIPYLATRGRCCLIPPLYPAGGAVEDFPLCPPGGAVEAALLAVLRLPDPPHRAVRLQAMG